MSWPVPAYDRLRGSRAAATIVAILPGLGRASCRGISKVTPNVGH